MTLEEFKGIFWLEYAHRLLGRAVGVAFVLPFLWFLLRRAFDRRLGVTVLAIGVLGALQGLLGWYMVQSGLVDRPDVSPYRLAAHLGLAVLIYGCLIWVALGLLAGGATALPRRLGRWRGALWGAAALVFVTILSGAFVAGNDAGLAYNTFPLMAERIVPPDIFLVEPLWRNFFETVPLGAARPSPAGDADGAGGRADLGGGAALAAVRAGARRVARGGGGAVLCQFGLGIATLLDLRAGAAGRGPSGGRDGGVHGCSGRASPAVSAAASACCAALRPRTKRLMRRGMKPIRPSTASPSRAF